jgi:hypothetical protein
LRVVGLVKIHLESYPGRHIPPKKKKILEEKGKRKEKKMKVEG